MKKFSDLKNRFQQRFRELERDIEESHLMIYKHGFMDCKSKVDTVVKDITECCIVGAMIRYRNRELRYKDIFMFGGLSMPVNQVCAYFGLRRAHVSMLYTLNDFDGEMETLKDVTNHIRKHVELFFEPEAFKKSPIV